MFIESIQINNGIINLKEAHLHRIQQTQLEIYNKISIFNLNLNIPNEFQKGIVKCRLRYHHTINEIIFQTYSIKLIRSLKIVEANELDYHLKYSDRDVFTTLKKNYPFWDEILISQHGRLTDTTFSNIILFDGKNYVTPDSYLLNGIQRQTLLKAKIIQERTIFAKDLHLYQSLFLINAMLDWNTKIQIPINNIVF